VLTNLARNTLTEKSDQVVTTGLGGVFPADLLVGVVQDVVCKTAQRRPSSA